MAKYKLTYFDLSASRGEECRMALYAAGVDFEDHRITQEQWAALKPATPFGALPMLELPGKQPLAQSNAILTYVGRRYDLHPQDAWEAARHDAILHAVEELRASLVPSGKIADPAEKKKAREELAKGHLKVWGANMEKQIRGTFVGGERLQVADIKLFQVMHSFRRGVMDHIPADIFSEFPKLDGVYEAVSRHPKIVEWRAKH